MVGTEDVTSGVAATALLVNWSRARLAELSGDRFAADWIAPSRRAQVEQLRRSYREEVYADDDVVVAVRGRAVLDALLEVRARTPDLRLVVLGCGFSSYPWLLAPTPTLEVDLPHVVAAKAGRARELVAAGRLPERPVRWVEADLSDLAGVAALGERLREQVPAGAPVAVVAEGLLYYLSPAAAVRTLGLARRFAHPRLAIVSYWPDTAAGHAVLASQAAWFAGRDVPTEPTLLAHQEVAAGLGGRVERLDPVQLQQRYEVQPIRPESAIVPEHVALARWEDPR